MIKQPIDPDLRLYTVTLETEVIVLASDADDAQEIARRHRGDEDSWDAHASPMKRLPPEWDLDACPYADEPTGTVGELIEQGHAPEYKRAKP